LIGGPAFELSPAFGCFLTKKFSNGLFAVVAEISAKLVEDLEALFAAVFLIAWNNGFLGLFFDRWTH
jgi:hypothetical protein